MQSREQTAASVLNCPAAMTHAMPQPAEGTSVTKALGWGLLGAVLAGAVVLGAAALMNGNAEGISAE